MAITKISNILPQRLKQAGIEKGVRAAQILEISNKILDEMFGPDTSNFKARAIIFKQQQLHIATTIPSLQQELTMKKIKIINKVNGNIGKDVVKRLIVVR